MHFAHVGRSTRNTQHAGLLVEQVRHARSVQTLFLHDESHSTRVDVAAACTHHQTFERGQSHAGVHTFAILDGGYRTAIAHMTRDDARTFRLDAQEFTHALGHIAVRRPMEAITANAIFLIQLIRNRIHVSIVRHCLMESRVKHTDLRNVGKQCRNSSHTLQVGRIVKRSQIIASIDGIKCFLVQYHGFAETFAAVYDTVSDSPQLIERLQCTIFLAGQSLEDELHTHGMFRNVLLENNLFPIRQSQFQERTFQTDFFNTALCQYSLGSHVKQFILDG